MPTLPSCKSGPVNFISPLLHMCFIKLRLYIREIHEYFICDLSASDGSHHDTYSFAGLSAVDSSRGGYYSGASVVKIGQVCSTLGSF